MKHTIDKVPGRFNEGPYWGNASMGALLYAEQGDLRFAVDQVKLWEQRDHTHGDMPVTFQQACALQQPEFSKAFKGSFAWQDGPCRTRLPGLTLRLRGKTPVTEFHAETDLASAVTELTWRRTAEQPRQARVWLHSETDVLVVEALNFDLLSAAVQADGWNLDLPALAPLAAWGYPEAERRVHAHGEHVVQGFSGDQVAVLSTWKSSALLLCTLAAGSASAVEQLCAGNEQRMQTVAEDLEAARARHLASWHAFWEAFVIELPDAFLQRAVENELYKLYCNARPDSWPMTLQGIWNHDRAMPAWTGDWHNDLNVQACYWAAFKTNHADLARSYIDYYAEAVPHFNERSERFMGVADGISVPTMMAPGGKGAGVEWSFWNALLGPELYSAIDFCWYYEFTQDEAMLRSRIVPFLSGVARFYEKVLERRDDGLLHVPFAHSPEIFDGKGLVLTDDTTFMVSSLRYVLEKLAEYQDQLGAADAADYWRALVRDLVQTAESESGLQLWPGRDLGESHRHFSHLFPVYPLGQVSRAAPEQDALIQASLDRLANCGAVAYAAFSFPYRAILCARAGRGMGARAMLYNYLLGLRAPNTFCVNGDAFRSGVINASASSAGQAADAFTLEAGLIVPAAVCEMLAHRAGDTVWLLPAIPPDWKQGSVKGLTIEGGHRLDLKFSDHTLSRATLYPGSNERLTIVIGAAGTEYEVRCGAKADGVSGAEPFFVTLRKDAEPVKVVRRDPTDP